MELLYCNTDTICLFGIIPPLLLKGFDYINSLLQTLPVKSRICIITGHYGSGKTNLAVNMALKLKAEGKNVTVVDLDIVNPYFRTADFKELFDKNDIKTIFPTYANTNLDIPSLPASVNSIFDNEDENSYAIVDVGGDDAGSIALGRYSNDLERRGYDMFYVINQCRYLTREPKTALELLDEVEAVSRLKATALINNTNLAEQTTKQIIENSFDFSKKISEECGLPLAFTAFPSFLDGSTLQCENLFEVEVFVKTPW